jgi:hypothetical protein
VAIAGLVTVAVSSLRQPQPSTVTTADGIIVENLAYGFTVEHPVNWHRATTTLTPNLIDPVQILALGTGDLPPGGHSCAQQPVAALEAMSPTDALITVQERLSPEMAGLAPDQPLDEAAGFPARPGQFPPSGSSGSQYNSTVVECLAEPPAFDHWWFAFNDAGRGFHILVAIGTGASERTRAETWAILDSLQFEPN